MSDQLGRPAFWRFTDALAAGWRRVPLRGPGRILDAALRHATRRFGDGVIEVGAGKVLINSTNPPEASLFWWRSYEHDVIAALRASLRRGMTAIDVGANCGVVTLLMREAVGAEGLVLSIDPSPAACRRVAEQAALNGYANVVVEQIALGVADGTQETYFAASVGIGALPPADAQYVTSEAVDVEVGTLDHLVAKHQLDHVDLLKVDTDGAELQILRGARTTLLNLKPILILELNPGGLGRRRDSIGELLQLLSDSGYRLLRPRFEKTCSVLARPPRLVGFERHPHEIQLDRAASANVVALLDGHDAHDAAALALGVPSG